MATVARRPMRELLHHYRRAGQTLRRLGAMGAAELALRGQQELRKRLERAGLWSNDIRWPGVRKPRHTAPSVMPSFAAGGESWRQQVAVTLFEDFRRRGPERFFAGAVDPCVASVLDERLPDARARTLAAATAIAAGRFRILGYPWLSFGDPIDWHLDAVSGRRAKLEHWSRIDPLDPSAVGDSKVIWELNRHQWMVTLAQAYCLSGDEHYADLLVSRLEAWMQANPPGMGINWSSSLEVALRLIAWTWAVVLLRNSSRLSADWYANLLAWIRAHASHVERYLSYYFSPNTHLTGEALGLYYAGTMFPELQEAERWQGLGERILIDQLERQVHSDGVYFEQSTCYQRYTIEIYLHFLFLSQCQGRSVPAAVFDRVQRMLDFLLAVRRPAGPMNAIGDADGGSLLPLTPREPDDFRGVFALGAVLFGRSDYAWAAENMAAEVVWALGKEGVQRFDALQAAPPADPPSRLFRDGGYVLMRSGWERDAHQLIFDVGPLGCPVSAGHGHADLLSVQCASFGEPYLVDPGTGSYSSDSPWRNYFRSTQAHCTITIDGTSQAEPNGPFKWHQRPRARLRRWISNDVMDMADAEHNAYHRLAQPVTHRRRVVFVKPRYWVIVDDLVGRGSHRIDLRYQFAPMDVGLGSDGWVAARHTAGRELRLLVCAGTHLDVNLYRGQDSPIQGWVSPDYGRREPAPMLVYSATASLPLRILSLLFPIDHRAAVPPIVAVSLEQGRVDLVFESDLDTLHIGEEDIILQRTPAEQFDIHDSPSP